MPILKILFLLLLTLSLQATYIPLSKTYDKLNRLSSVTDAKGTTSYSYDAIGRQTLVTYPNGVTTNYSYDSRNRVTTIEHKDSSGNILQSFAYTLDNVGNRTKIVEHTGRTTDYAYNSVNQLTKETVTNDPNGQNTVTTYSYDLVGNLTTKTIDGVPTDYNYNDNDQLTQQGTSTFTYDANGNLIQKDDTTYSYDDQNRLIKVQTPTNAIEYTYDANNNRIAKTTTAGTTTYLVDTNTPYAQVITESKADGTEVQYTYGNDLISNNSSYFLTDALGSTRGLIDESETLTDTYSYTPYGELSNHTGSSENNFLYTGEQYDSETEDYYLRARYYSPQQARFTSIDPFEGRMFEPITLNDYIYAGDNPIIYTDPSGEFFGMSLGMNIATLGILTGGAITTLAINNNQKSGYNGNIFTTIYLYDIKSFLRAELLPTVWLIGEALTWQENKLKDETYKKHKNRCDRFPKREDYDSDCAYYSALISHTESCIRAYENWDNKYNPGRHDEKINNWKNTVKKNKKNYKRSCR